MVVGEDRRLVHLDFCSVLRQGKWPCKSEWKDTVPILRLVGTL